jgi:glucose-6-phosphate-specific signal transduction histidine kinase
MNKTQKNVVLILVAVSVVGVLGIPLGDPRFIPQALLLEGCFISLAVLTAKNYKRVYIPNFAIAGIVIAGNSAFYKHIEIMTTLHPLYNALVLITGGYVLQVLLLITNYLAYRQHKHLTLSGRTD